MPSQPNHSPRILQLAFACNPEKGSEEGIGWHRAIQSAKAFPTWVICNEAENRESIERYLAQHGPIENLHFEFISSGTSLERQLRQTPGCYYFAYNLWHRRAFKIATKLHEKVRFDLTHLTTYGGFREPGYLWKLDVPFVWGPVAGAQNYPWRFLTSAGWRGAAGESFRNVANWYQMKFSLRVGKAARRAAAMLAATTTNARALAARRGSPLEVILDVGVQPLRKRVVRNFRHGGPLRILWSGVMQSRKALHLLLHAVAGLPVNTPFELRILGNGPMEEAWRKLARQLGIEKHCSWLGWQKHSQAVEHFTWADAFVFTSLRDTSGTVVLESLAAGTPVVCLDHQGMQDMVTPNCGVRLPVTNPSDVIRALRDVLVQWHRNREILEQLSRAAPQRAEHYSWDRHGERIRSVYRRVLNLPGEEVAGDAPVEEPQESQNAEACCLGPTE